VSLRDRHAGSARLPDHLGRLVTLLKIRLHDKLAVGQWRAHDRMW
jgi:hypothetical protein